MIQYKSFVIETWSYPKKVGYTYSYELELDLRANQELINRFKKHSQNVKKSLDQKLELPDSLCEQVQYIHDLGKSYEELLKETILN